MKKALLKKMAAFLLFFSLPLLASAAETEDPYYKQWASFKVGSNVTLVGRSEDSSGIESFTQTITLKEIADDHLVVEIARKEEKSAPILKNKKVDRFVDKDNKLEYNGQEEITLAGKRFTCHVYTLRIMDDSGKEMMVFQYWFNADIPGFAKVVSNYQDQGKKYETVQSAVSWEKK